MDIQTMPSESLSTESHVHSIAGFPAVSNASPLPASFAPLIRNAWYVMAESRDVEHALKPIMVLGQPLVYYRTEDGEPIVLDDRCAHRRFSLSKSRLAGDTIECGYHGATYDRTGACIWAPTAKNAPQFGVRRYPSVEVGSWLWVWMGDPACADPALVPMPTLDAAETWRTTLGYKLNPGNYMQLIENLLDLSHLHFLHGPDISTREEADNSPRPIRELPANSVGWYKVTPDVETGLFGALAGGDPKRIVTNTITDTQFGPSMNYGITTRTLGNDESDAIYPLRFHIFHALTPVDLLNTHQFFLIAFNVDLAGGLDSFRDFSRDVVFQQDVEAIATATAAILADDRTGMVEYSVPGDRFGLRMRQILREMSRAETQAAPSGSSTN